ncbi:MAG TPA: helicase-related protein [Bacillota bacterium]|nr:helicase-related protein [Bacillota bacterium]
MLASKARSILGNVRFVIIDEIHALFPNKRGAHLALSLENLEALTNRPLQRIGLSATQRPLDEVAAFLGGGSTDQEGQWRPRPVQIIDTGQRKKLDLQILMPVEDLRYLPEKSVWPSVYQKLLDEIRDHQSTLIFVNNRRLAERITANLNDLAGQRVAQTHHGSLSKERRLDVEVQMKSGKLPCIVATSSLELGIDIGSIDLVIQVESPKEVARGLQRVGRAGHIVGMPSTGRIIPKSRGDLLECTMILREMQKGHVEESHAPENSLDILAQQIVASTAAGPQDVDGLYAQVCGAYPFRRLTRSLFDKVIRMLAGVYDDGRFTDLKPSIFWDRIHGRVSVTERGRRLVYTNGGTIPDRGYFGVYLSGSNQRLGELDEEFVAERRLGERFSLGTTTWRIEEIRRDRVIVSHAARGEAMVPFWKGEALGRSFELGKRFGSFLGEAERHLDKGDFETWLLQNGGIDESAAHNLSEYLQRQKRATGCLPTERRIVVEEFRDELGEWRTVIHSLFGARLNTPLAMLIRGQLEQDGIQVEVMQDDNAILLVAPGGSEPPVIDWRRLSKSKWLDDLIAQLRKTHLFAMIFRQNAARALLLPKSPHGRGRTPLWLARLKAADLLQTVSDYPDFPIVTETFRECLTEVFDLKALEWLMTELCHERIEVIHCRRQHSSPFTHTLQFNFFGNYMYVLDLPKGEQRFKALGMDRDALRELLGAQGLRGILDPEAIKELATEASGFSLKTVAKSAEEFHYWLVKHGEWRVNPESGAVIEDWEKIRSFIEQLEREERILQLTWPAYGKQITAWVAIEDAPDYLGAIVDCRFVKEGSNRHRPSSDLAEARHRLSRRFVHAHGPFLAQDLMEAYGWESATVDEELAYLEAAGLVQQGEFREGCVFTEWCDVDHLQRIHRRSLAKARRAIKPRDIEDYPLFLARWQHVANPLQEFDGLRQSLAQLAALPLPTAIWEDVVLPLRVEGFRKTLLDRVIHEGEMLWQASGSGDGQRLSFFLPGQPRLVESGGSVTGDVVEAIRKALKKRGAMFFNQILQETGCGYFDTLDALKALMEHGEVTNDSLEPVRRFPQQVTKGRGRIMGTAALSGMGRWSLFMNDDQTPIETWAELLLRRYGVVVPSLLSGEEFRWTEVAPIYEKWEMVGKIRRGYFIQGLGGLQYALPEAVEELRQETVGDEKDYLVLHWQDPANPYRNAIELPPDLGVFKIQPDIVVLDRGKPIMIAGGKRLRIGMIGKESSFADIFKAFSDFCRKTHWNQGHITVATFNGRPVLETDAAEYLATSGFERGYRQMTWWKVV